MALVSQLVHPTPLLAPPTHSHRHRHEHLTATAGLTQEEKPKGCNETHFFRILLFLVLSLFAGSLFLLHLAFPGLRSTTTNSRGLEERQG